MDGRNYKIPVTWFFLFQTGSRIPEPQLGLSPPCLCQVLCPQYWLLVCCTWIFWHLHHGMWSLILIKISPGAPAWASAPGELPSSTSVTCTKRAGLPESSLILSVFGDMNDVLGGGLIEDCADSGEDLCTWGGFTRTALKIDWRTADGVLIINCRYW